MHCKYIVGIIGTDYSLLLLYIYMICVVELLLLYQWL